MTKKKNIFSRLWTKFNRFSLFVKIVLVLCFLFFTVQALIQFYPFLWVVNNSLKSGSAISEDKLAITREWQFSNYIKVFSEFKGNGDVDYWTMLFNSFWQTGGYLFVNLLSSYLVAYALAKFRFPGGAFLFTYLVFKQTIPIFGSGAAAFKLRYALGMINNPTLFWLSWLDGFDFSAFVLYGCFKGISQSYSESAKLDGANEWQIMWQIIFPQAFPAVVALLVTNFVTQWNNYAMTQINLNEFPNLAYGLMTYEKKSIYGDQGVYYAALIMTAIPGIILYAVSQNLIVKNMAVGGLKG